MSHRRRRRPPRRPVVREEWVPQTRLGRLVHEGDISSIEEIFQQHHRIVEHQIVDMLVPNLEEEVVSINLVQRQTDAGRKSRFKAVVVVGNRNGYVGVGEGKAKEVGPAIRIGIARAKMELAPIRRGCGSWECSCSEPHSVPFTVTGNCGSTRVKIIPAPKGLGLVIGENAIPILRLVGIEDAWTQTFGETRTTTNYVKATFDALKETYRVVHPRDWVR